MESFSWWAVLHFFLHSFLFGLLCWFLHQWFIGETLRRKKDDKIILALSFVVLVALMIYPYNYLMSVLYDVSEGVSETPLTRKQYMLFLRGVVTSGLFYFIQHHKMVVFQKQESQLEIERLKQAQLEVSLNSLKEQLSPHFLFNTLNTLSTLTSEKHVKDFVNELSNIYRHVLQHKQKDTVTLTQELNFIHSYVYILKSRFEDAIHIDIDISEADQALRIPALTLQLLIENAVKHNMATSYKPLYIKIYREGDFLVVNNNLQAKNSVSYSTGTGLHNIRFRYQLLFNKEIVIEKTVERFTVKLPLVA
ncbi:histidine kinase [Chitinophaga sancti]|nr:histidine kinase [Chitinophaga sancti]WQD63699.1 histidine kinase [Chitinophaga sancti]WQG90676.1 histidine kinase [Chitinophaga sancti]